MPPSEQYTDEEFALLFDPDYRAYMWRTYGRNMDLHPWRLVLNRESDIVVKPEGNVIPLRTVTRVYHIDEPPALDHVNVLIEEGTADVATSRSNRVAIEFEPQEYRVGEVPWPDVHRLLVSAEDPEGLVRAIERRREGGPPEAPKVPATERTKRGKSATRPQPTHKSDMVFNYVSFYLWRPVWVKESLVDVASNQQDFEVEKLTDEMFSQRLDCGITISVQRQGMFTFDFSGWASAYDGANAFAPLTPFGHYSRLRADVVNAYLACLYTAGETLQPAQSPHPLSAWAKMWVTAQDLILSRSHKTNEITFPNTRNLPLLRAHWRQEYSGPARQDWRHMGRIRVIEEQTLEASLSALSQILNSPTADLDSLVALYQQACVTYESESYGPAAVLAWAIVEQMLNRLWRQYLDANRNRVINNEETEFINSKRRDDRLQSREYTASVIAETLSLVDELPFSLYNMTLRARKARNSWMHGLSPVSSESASQAIETAEAMIELVTQVKLHARLVTFSW